jgi:hypothetical protein
MALVVPGLEDVGLRRIWHGAKRIALSIGWALQRAALFFLLTLVYVVGFGLTWVFAIVFQRSLLRQRAPESSASYFVEARGYVMSLGDGKHGS